MKWRMNDYLRGCNEHVQVSWGAKPRPNAKSLNFNGSAKRISECDIIRDERPVLKSWGSCQDAEDYTGCTIVMLQAPEPDFQPHNLPEELQKALCSRQG
ncbi:MAG: hypothetical protein SGPRY_004192 [Prymnesium sp.]